MCCEKRSEAGAQAPAHPVPDRNVSGQRTKGMRGRAASPMDVSVSDSEARSDAHPDAHTGARCGLSAAM